MTKLKLLRMQRGLSQRQMASVLGMDPTFLSRLECRWFTRCPNREVVEERLRAFFGPEESFDSLMQDVSPDKQPAFPMP